MESTSDGILSRISSHHASGSTKLHCLYGLYFLGLTVSNLSVIFHKTERTIRNWIKDWEENRNVDRHQGIVNPRKYDAGKQRFILECYEKFPNLSQISLYMTSLRCHRYQPQSHSMPSWTALREITLSHKICKPLID